MSLIAILLVVLLVIALIPGFGMYPAISYPAAWGPYPVTVITVLLVVLLILALTGRI